MRGRVSLPIHERRLPLTIPVSPFGPAPVWRSQTLDTKGNTIVNAFVALAFLSDTTGTGLQIQLELVQSFGSGPATTSVAPFPAQYAVAVPLGPVPQLPALVFDQGLGLDAFVQLVVTNPPGGFAHNLVASINGVIVAGDR